VDVGLAVDDLTSGGHLGGQRVVGIGVRGGVAGGIGRHGEAVDGADEGHDGGVDNVLFGSLLGQGCDQFGVADFQDMHGRLLAGVVLLVRRPRC
jgi:hypothetical protein